MMKIEYLKQRGVSPSLLFYGFVTWGALSLAVILGVRFAESAQEELDRAEERLETLRLASDLRVRLESNLNSDLVLARALVAELSIEPATMGKRFDQVAAEFRGYSRDIRNIGLAEGTVLTRVHPVEGNEKAIGLDYTKIPEQWPAVRRTIESGTTVVAGPVDLVQGGRAIISRTPVLAPPTADSQERKYLGLVSIVIDLPGLLARSGIPPHDSLQVALRGKDGRGAEGDVFYGDPSLFDRGASILDVKLPNGAWQMAAVPVGGWAQGAGPDPVYRWFGGGLIVLLAGVTLLLCQHFRHGYLRANEENFRLATSAADEVIYEWRPAEGTVRASESIHRLLAGGGAHPEADRSWWCDRVHPDDRQRVADEFRNALMTSDRYSIEYRILREDGSEAAVWDKGRILREANDIGRCVGSAVDVTEKRALEGQLRQSQKMEAIGALAGGVAHDFNNILTSIVGNAHLLERFLIMDRDDEKTPLVRNVLTGAERARLLVKQILTFSRSEKEQSAPLDLVPQLKEIYRLLRTTTPRRIEMELKVPSSPCWIVGNSVQVHQVVMNLCTNSVQAIGTDSGTIRLELEERVIGDVEARTIGGIEPGRSYMIKVTDDGEGMDKKTQDRIFEPFFTTKPTGSGTGLGLSIVHGIVGGHQGGVKVRSEIGKGTEIEIYFSASEAPEQPVETPPVDVKPKAQGQKVLVLDDEFIITSICQSFLESEGFRVVVFNDPIEALGRLESDPYFVDIVLTDLSMPGMDGVQFARKALCCRPDLPIVLMSGNVDDAELDKNAARIFERVLSKPIPFGGTSRILLDAMQRKE